MAADDFQAKLMEQARGTAVPGATASATPPAAESGSIEATAPSATAPARRRRCFASGNSRELLLALVGHVASWSPPTRTRRGPLTWVVSAGMLALTTWLSGQLGIGFRIDGVAAAFVGALIVGLASFLFEQALR